MLVPDTSHRKRLSAGRMFHTLLHPFYWERWVRRTFLLGLPLSLPLWLVLIAVSPVAGLLLVFWQAAVEFWSAPRRYRQSVVYYGYGEPYQRPPVNGRAPAPVGGQRAAAPVD